MYFLPFIFFVRWLKISDCKFVLISWKSKRSQNVVWVIIGSKLTNTFSTKPIHNF